MRFQLIEREQILHADDDIGCCISIGSPRLSVASTHNSCSRSVSPFFSSKKKCLPEAWRQILGVLGPFAEVEVGDASGGSRAGGDGVRDDNMGDQVAKSREYHVATPNYGAVSTFSMDFITSLHTSPRVYKYILSGTTLLLLNSHSRFVQEPYSIIVIPHFTPSPSHSHSP